MSKIKEEIIEFTATETISDIKYMLRKLEFSDEVVSKVYNILIETAPDLNPWLNKEVE